MKFIVDELPYTPHECPFYKDYKCVCCGCNGYCERFDHDYYIVDLNAKECIMLKEGER